MAKTWHTALIEPILRNQNFNVSPNTVLPSHPLADLSPFLLEAVVPGYSSVSRFLAQALGLDVSVIISVSLTVYAIIKSWSFLRKQTLHLFRTFFMSECTFDSEDEVYSWVMDWVASQHIGNDSRSLIATGGSVPCMSFDGDSPFSKKSSSSREPPKISYFPSMGSHFFWQGWRLFRLERYEPEEKKNNYWIQPGFKRIDVRLSCVGRSTDPVKELLKGVSLEYFNRSTSRTKIYRPAPKFVRKQGRTLWTKVSTRPSRPLETIILDERQKKKVVDDMTEYLLPSTAKWYANRGVPYRRGYLLHGPPGTGKTSLSFALAGHFRLPVYCFSLQEPTLTEEDLAALFSALPSECIVVLEDIDSAGIKNRGASLKISPNSSSSEGTPTEVSSHAVRTRKAMPVDGDEDSNEGSISLSGLLNIIDGIASKEGRILIMTTNALDALDPALIRPGRVDMEVFFGLTTRDDAEHLFKLMFKEDCTEQSGDAIVSEKPPKMSDEQKLLDDAKRFADVIPPEIFSAAELQGYLLTKKRNAEAAIQDATAWVEEQKKKRL